MSVSPLADRLIVDGSVMMMMMMKSAMIFILTASESSARIHQLKLKNETRFLVHLNSFGYFADGTLELHLVSLKLPQEKSGSGKFRLTMSASLQGLYNLDFHNCLKAKTLSPYSLHLLTL
ncbi:protein GPR108-like [Sinocyclocheilus anshuiensis]|uniref:protein GPR108-like n=1 Tax=Sinocyclocheilus anshuiensis TaxID=1608454 RepID=UPI0007B9A7B9|nr:PREDICTED: protein GPR108-like [Sinocyclocheilus anshuiensis]